MRVCAKLHLRTYLAGKFFLFLPSLEKEATFRSAMQPLWPAVWVGHASPGRVISVLIIKTRSLRPAVKQLILGT